MIFICWSPWFAAWPRLICDFQSKVGPLMVDTFDDLMVYFLEAPQLRQLFGLAPNGRLVHGHTIHGRQMPTRLQRLTRSLSSRPWNGYQAKNCGILEHQSIRRTAIRILPRLSATDCSPDQGWISFPISRHLCIQQIYAIVFFKAASSNLTHSRTYPKSS